MGLDVLGMNILTRRQDDHILCAADDIKMSVGRAGLDPRSKPAAVGKRLGGRVRIA